ncbi:MAG: hypothetical protein J6A69_05790, partial [Clostridia bacterium]|nr:hypothetical protein [Clostridia bacterium]
MKKIICIILSICLIFSLFTAMPVFAASGICGDNLTWRVENNVLTISGTGAMYDYTVTEFSSQNAPWACVASEAEYLGYPTINKVVIEEGVTYIGSYAFTGVFDSDGRNV